jgi:SAM-dependent methyltransferase
MQGIDDKAFDDRFPRYVRERSQQFWTPVEVAQRVAETFREHGAARILDVGCGPGKFCIVAGRTQSALEVHGIEQRPRLVRLGAALARTFGASNVRFSAGDATKAPWEDYDGFYFFNPFAESVLPPCDRFDNRAIHTRMRFSSELLRVESRLSQARVGTVVITYHGLGGPIPASYELVSDARAGSDRLRTWVQHPRKPGQWVWLETLGKVIRVSQTDVRCALASLLCKDLD